MTTPHPNALVEAWLTRSRDLGHAPQENYNDWGGHYYTAACPNCKATMTLEIHAPRGIANSYAAHGVAYRRQCNDQADWLEHDGAETYKRIANAIADSERPS